MTANIMRLHWVALPLAALGLGVATARAQASEQWDKYLWQTACNSEPAQWTSNLQSELRVEIDKILAAGPLAPVRTVYADLEQDPYFMYWQPGRVITTLAMAWPYLSEAQREKTTRYIHTELDDPQRAPWAAKGFIPPDNGSRRELHTFHEARGWDRYWAMWGHSKPRMGGCYGLWLYAGRSGDWGILQKHYPELGSLYSRGAEKCDVYGTMGAHIAMARIARHFGDAAGVSLASSNAARAFQAGTNFPWVEAATQRYWKERYGPRQKDLVYEGWMFLDLCPEVGRYLADHVKAATLERHTKGLRQYPLFWLREAPYFSRWTGDEGVGIPTELMGMIVPVERWVAAVPAQKLELYTRSAPICIGDCYWLEAVVAAIDASGNTRWENVPP